MSRELMTKSGTIVKKLKVKMKNDKIEERILFFTESCSSNVTPRTKTWFLTKVLTSEESFLSYLQNFKSDISGGMIHISGSSRDKDNRIDTFLQFYNRNKTLYKNSDFIEDKNNEELILNEEDINNLEKIENFQEIVFKSLRKKRKINYQYSILPIYSIEKNEKNPEKYEENIKNFIKIFFSPNILNSLYYDKIEILYKKINNNRNIIFDLQFFKQYIKLKEKIKSINKKNIDFNNFFELEKTISFLFLENKLNFNKKSNINIKILEYYLDLSFTQNIESYRINEKFLTIIENFPLYFQNKIKEESFKKYIYKYIYKLNNLEKEVNKSNYEFKEQQIIKIKRNIEILKKEYINKELDFTEKIKEEQKKFKIKQEKVTEKLLEAIKSFHSLIKYNGVKEKHIESSLIEFKKDVIGMEEYIDTNELLKYLNNTSNEFIQPTLNEFAKMKIRKDNYTKKIVEIFNVTMENTTINTKTREIIQEEVRKIFGDKEISISFINKLKTYMKNIQKNNKNDFNEEILNYFNEKMDKIKNKNIFKFSQYFKSKILDNHDYYFNEKQLKILCKISNIDYNDKMKRYKIKFPILEKVINQINITEIELY